ncbi:hypothetical protein E2C01_001440 [Portunus trituberculatus]|uniref:Uncharacterized protein n=1 Tax=Portunus trituberculatus TaxID=210409 RepID=A0A5B7CKF9_PORTR|nr:hypothetical protein [Portunus trituberculatus]
MVLKGLNVPNGLSKTSDVSSQGSRKRSRTAVRMRGGSRLTAPQGVTSLPHEYRAVGSTSRRRPS